MRTGRLRRVVTLQQPTLSQGGSGAWRNTGWTTFAAGVFADIDDTVGREAIQAGQVNPQRPVTVTIRYLAGITAEMRVLYGARALQIVSVVNIDQRNRVLILTCLEKAP